MQIYINGDEQQISDDLTMSNLVQQLDLGDQRFAIVPYLLIAILHGGTASLLMHRELGR